MLNEENLEVRNIINNRSYSEEFEYFAPHPENSKFIPLLEVSENIYLDIGQQSSRPTELGFKGSIYWLYHKVYVSLQYIQVY